MSAGTLAHYIAELMHPTVVGKANSDRRLVTANAVLLGNQITPQY